MKCIIERTTKYDDGKVHTSYLTKMTLFYTLWGPRQNAVSFDDEDDARRIVMQSRRSDNEIYTVIPLSGEAQGERE